MKTSTHLTLTTSPLSRSAKKPHAASPIRCHRLLYRKRRHHPTEKELDAETGLLYYGARYLDSKTSRWLSGDPAVGGYVPEAPVSDEARKRNKSLPGQGGVFNCVNLHAYHYAGNNPVRYVDPDGKSDIDFENKTINADLADINDLDMANRQLAVLQNEGFKVFASDNDGNQRNFDSFGELTDYLNEIDPFLNLIPDGSTMTIGVGMGIFAVGGLGVEAGVSYSAENGYDVYLTGGIGYGAGVSTRITGNINVTSGVNLHKQTGMTATAGVGPAANFDLKNGGKFTGISGVAVGGGVLHTGTITARGVWGDIKSGINKLPRR